jgi:hypothetical protein
VMHSAVNNARSVLNACRGYEDLFVSSVLRVSV